MSVVYVDFSLTEGHNSCPIGPKSVGGKSSVFTWPSTCFRKLYRDPVYTD